MTDVVDLPGYHDGPFARRPELLEQMLFWHGHLYSCAQGDAGELLWGAGYAWAEFRNFQRRLWARGDWPVFTIPLAAGHRLHVVHRTLDGEAGVDYLVYHPDWDRAELITQGGGHFIGPGLSWTELVAAVDNAPAGGTDPHAHWTAVHGDVRVNDGRYSFRNPANDFALTDDRMARVSAALAP